MWNSECVYVFIRVHFFQLFIKILVTSIVNPNWWLNLCSTNLAVNFDETLLFYSVLQRLFICGKRSFREKLIVQIQMSREFLWREHLF